MFLIDEPRHKLAEGGLLSRRERKRTPSGKRFTDAADRANIWRGRVKCRFMHAAAALGSNASPRSAVNWPSSNGVGRERKSPLSEN